MSGRAPGFRRGAAEGPPMVAVPFEIEVIDGVRLSISAVKATAGKRSGQYLLAALGLEGRKPSAYSPRPAKSESSPKRGRMAGGTPAASTCGSETTTPHTQLMNQKPAAPVLVSRTSVSRPSCFVCRAR